MCIMLATAHGKIIDCDFFRQCKRVVMLRRAGIPPGSKQFFTITNAAANGYSSGALTQARMSALNLAVT